MSLAQFITAHAKQIVAEWEEFARVHLYAARELDLIHRRDHVEGMLNRIARDLDTPQTKREQVSKSKGLDDAAAESDTAANAHGTDRASTGFSPVDVLSEFRALRASILRLWSETQGVLSQASVEEVTRFNEAIDQLLVESMTRYGHDVERSKDLFLGVIGHDLRNPLGAIMMSATLMITQEGPDWPHLKTASRILTAGTRMDGLISDLVDLTRTQLGSGIPIVRTDMDLRTIGRQTVDEIIAFHPGCDVRFEASGDLRGSWDAGRIGQLLSNLVGNAFQHGSETVPIEVALRGEADHVVLSVFNKGPRIPPHHLAGIFDPFTQVEPERKNKKDARSTGLGLYIVQAIVIAHHGTIAVESTDRGTTFTATLPRSAANREQRIAQRA